MGYFERDLKMSILREYKLCWVLSYIWLLEVNDTHVDYKDELSH